MLNYKKKREKSKCKKESREYKMRTDAQVS